MTTYVTCTTSCLTQKSSSLFQESQHDGRECIPPPGWLCTTIPFGNQVVLAYLVVPEWNDILYRCVQALCSGGGLQLPGCSCLTLLHWCTSPCLWPYIMTAQGKQISNGKQFQAYPGLTWCQWLISPVGWASSHSPLGWEGKITGWDLSSLIAQLAKNLPAR